MRNESSPLRKPVSKSVNSRAQQPSRNLGQLDDSSMLPLNANFPSNMFGEYKRNSPLRSRSPPREKITSHSPLRDQLKQNSPLRFTPDLDFQNSGMKTQLMQKMNSLEKYRRSSGSRSPMRQPIRPSDLIPQDYSVAARLEIQTLIQEKDQLAFQMKQQFSENMALKDEVNDL